MLLVRDVTKTYRLEDRRSEPLRALSNVSFEVGEEEVVCILGPSGCGKTTLLKIIAGLLPAESGDIQLNGEVVVAPGPDKAMVFQNFALLPWLSVVSNIAIGLEAAGVSKAERVERAHRSVEQVGLKGFENSYPGELSGGMQQRVGLARALVVDPEVLLMDEPFGALDAQTRRLMQEELIALHEKQAKPTVIVTHDMEEAVRLGDRVVLLTGRPGRVDEIVAIKLPRPRPKDIESDPRFGESVRHLWERLRTANDPEA